MLTGLFKIIAVLAFLGVSCRRYSKNAALLDMDGYCKRVQGEHMVLLSSKMIPPSGPKLPCREPLRPM